MAGEGVELPRDAGGAGAWVATLHCYTRSDGSLPRADDDCRREAAEDLNLDAFIAQGMDYSEGGGGLERLSKLFQDLRLTHPMPVRRVRLLLDWVHDGSYDDMVRGNYIRVGQEGSAREEADAAGAYYGERISAAFQQAGTSIAEAGQQLGDWLKRNRSE